MPYYKSPEEKLVLDYLQKEKVDENDCSSIIKLCEQAIKKYPFDLRLLNYLAYMYQKKQDNLMYEKKNFKFQKVLSTIYDSGDGKQCETAFHVTSVTHEYVLLEIFQMERDKQSLIENCDYLTFDKAKYGIDGLYFNVEYLLKKQEELFSKN